MREWHSLHGERPREAIDIVSSPPSAMVASPRPASSATIASDRTDRSLTFREPPFQPRQLTDRAASREPLFLLGQRLCCERPSGRESMGRPALRSSAGRSGRRWRHRAHARWLLAREAHRGRVYLLFSSTGRTSLVHHRAGGAGLQVEAIGGASPAQTASRAPAQGAAPGYRVLRTSGRAVTSRWSPCGSRSCGCAR
jgi:hypothetical protein